MTRPNESQPSCKSSGPGRLRDVGVPEEDLKYIARDFGDREEDALAILRQRTSSVSRATIFRVGDHTAHDLPETRWIRTLHLVLVPRE